MLERQQQKLGTNIRSKSRPVLPSRVQLSEFIDDADNCTARVLVTPQPLVHKQQQQQVKTNS